MEVRDWIIKNVDFYKEYGFNFMHLARQIRPTSNSSWQTFLQTSGHFKKAYRISIDNFSAFQIDIPNVPRTFLFNGICNYICYDTFMGFKAEQRSMKFVINSDDLP